MVRPRTVLAPALCLLAALAAAQPAFGDEYLAYTGIATDLRTHRFLYGEQHVLMDRQGGLSERVVLYTCRDGAPFARKRVSYVDPFAPDFSLEDASNGLQEGVRGAAGARQVYFRPRAGAPAQEAALPREPALVADAGFDGFVVAHWPSLAAGQDVALHFLIPSRLQGLGFRVGALRRDRIDGEPVEVFRLKLSGAFGLFLPGIDVFYGERDHVLLRYEGPSDLRDARGENYQVSVSFDPQNRRAAARDDFERGERAPLAPCT